MRRCRLPMLATGDGLATSVQLWMLSVKASSFANVHVISILGRDRKVLVGFTGLSM